MLATKESTRRKRGAKRENMNIKGEEATGGTESRGGQRETTRKRETKEQERREKEKREEEKEK